MRRALLALLVGCGGASAAPARPAAACAGDVVVGSQEELASVAACGTVDGSVAIRTAARLDLSALAPLEEVRGDLTIGPTFDVPAIRADGLRRVGGALRIVSNGAATAAHLPRLERAGSVEIGGNVALGTISAPALAEVGGDLRVEDNPALEILVAGALARVGGEVRVERTAQLGLVDLGRVEPVTPP